VTTVSTIVTADSKKDGGIGHVRLEWPVTIRWNERSRSFGIGGHVGVEYAAVAQTQPPPMGVRIETGVIRRCRTYGETPVVRCASMLSKKAYWRDGCLFSPTGNWK